jgi:glycosyltransferase involved in cell wall biosynthesis
MLRAGYDAAKVQTLPLPAPAAQPFCPPPTQGVPRFVFLGRFTPEKGVDWLLRAVSLVKREIAVDIAGAGHPARETEYRKLAESLKVSHRVTFHPWLEVDGVNALLREARALVFPSLWHEPAGLVALEAMAAGRAVIASRVGGVPEFVAEGNTGLLVEPGDSEHLAAAIEQLVDRYDLAECLGREGGRIAGETFSVEAHVAGLTDAYLRAVAAFPRTVATATLTPGLT